MVAPAAVVPGADGRLWPAVQLRRADPETMQMMSDLGLDVAFLDQAALPEDCTRLAALCPQLDLTAILSMLSGDQNAMLREALEDGRVTADSFLTWLRRYERPILDDERAQIRRIADPAGQAQEFLFDDGWSTLSDPESDGGAASAAPA